MKVSPGMLIAMVLFVAPHISLAKFATKSVKIDLVTEEDTPSYSISEKLYVEGCLQEAHNLAMSEVDDYKIEMVKVLSETDEEFDVSELLEDEDDDGDYDDEYDGVEDGDFEDDDDTWPNRNRQLWSYRFGTFTDYWSWQKRINKWLLYHSLIRLRWSSQSTGECDTCDDDENLGNGNCRRKLHEGTQIASDYFCECVTEKSPFPSLSKIQACSLTFDRVHVIEGQD
mmetsp:Transcript_17195/g.26617  ORF Transcript_17195/g.26617 Transcript_17195/m.26617 type:complete len:227 (+) Transcript_17195:143-823(+)